MNCEQPHPLIILPSRRAEEVAKEWFWGCVGVSVALHLLVVLAATGWSIRSPHLEKPVEPGLAVEFQIEALPSATSESPLPQEVQSPAQEKERPQEDTLRTESTAEKKPARPKQADTAGSPGNLSTRAPVAATPAPQGNPRPEYPDFARRKGWKGECLLRVVVTPEGRADVVTVHRSSGYAILDQSAVAAVRRWKFLPRVVGEQRLVSTIEVPVNFNLLDR